MDSIIAKDYVTVMNVETVLLLAARLVNLGMFGSIAQSPEQINQLFFAIAYLISILALVLAMRPLLVSRQNLVNRS